MSDKQTMTMALLDVATGKPSGVTVTVDVTPRGVAVGLSGYGEKTAQIGEGRPVHVEIYEGKPRVYIWGDINDEDITHSSDLSAASEALRKETLEGPDGLQLILDRSEIIPENPGEGTPALVKLGAETSTYDVAMNMGMVGDTTLSREQFHWLDEQLSEVEDFLKEL